MLIDCDRCTARAVRCDTCVVGLLLGPPSTRSAEPEIDAGRQIEAGQEPETVMVDMHMARSSDFDTAERAALQALAGVGLIPPLRLARGKVADTTRSFVMTERQSLAG